MRMLLFEQMVRLGQSLERYKDVKLQQFRSQLATEDSHVRIKSRIRSTKK